METEKLVPSINSNFSDTVLCYISWRTHFYCAEIECHRTTSFEYITTVKMFGFSKTQCSFCMKQYIFIKHRIQSNVIALHTVYNQLHNRTNCLSFHYSHYSLHRKPMFLSSAAFTLTHVLVWSDLPIRFILPLETSPDAKNIPSTYACGAGAECQQVLSCGCKCKFIKDCLLLLPKLNGDISTGWLRK